MYHEGGPYEVDIAEQCLNQSGHPCPVGDTCQCGRKDDGEHSQHQCHWCGAEWVGGTPAEEVCDAD